MTITEVFPVSGTFITLKRIIEEISDYFLSHSAHSTATVGRVMLIIATPSSDTLTSTVHLHHSVVISAILHK